MQMPKGALLHAHLEATVDASTLLGLGLEHENMCIRVLEPITPASLSCVLPQFGARPVAGAREYMTAPTITDVNYTPESWISGRRARDAWPAAMGGPEGFDAWVVKSMVINPEEAYGTHNTTRKIWMKFVGAFSVIYVSFLFCSNDDSIQCAPQNKMKGKERTS
jgi:adenosine deaminase CECR1